MTIRHRLVLFDIDGTVLTGGPAKEAFHIALVEVFGTAGPIEQWEFSGKTDPQIARELLTEAGLSRARVDQGLGRLWTRYLEEMERRIGDEPTRALPGAAALLSDLAGEGAVALGLLTGNVVGGARLKLHAAGLEGWLEVGAFGSDHEVRNELPAIAVQRALDAWGRPFDPSDVVVVGDTPRDVECGMRFGARTVAVATGNFGFDDLARTGADAVLEGLGDAELARTAIMA